MSSSPNQKIQHQSTLQTKGFLPARTHITETMRVLVAVALVGMLAQCSAAANMEKYYKRTGRKFLDEKEKEDGVHKLPSGMLFKVLKKGDGGKSPGPSDQCDVHYAGTLRCVVVRHSPF